MSTLHKHTHTPSRFNGRKGLWLKFVALTVMIGALVFAFTIHRQANASAIALDKAQNNLQTAMAKLKANRNAENSKEVQQALNAYRALGGTELIGATSMLAAPISSKAVAFGVSRPVRELPSVIQPGQNLASGKDIVRGKKNEFPVKTSNPSAPGDIDPKIQSVAKPGQNSLNIPAPIVNFEGLNGDGNIPIFGGRVLPPDTVGDVGPNHYVQSVNTLWRVFDKTGAPQTGVLTLGSLWASIPGACANANDGDPIVLYDPLADRWLISQFCTVANPNNHQLIAISTTPDPTGSYYLYDFMMPNNKFNDYPHFGVWPDGYYMSDNQFNQAGTAFLGGGCFAFDRKKMLQGDPNAGFIYFDVEPIDPTAGGMLPTDLDGVATPPVGMPNLFMEFRADDFGDPLDAVRIYEFHADFATPANSTFTVRPDVALAAFDARNPSGRGDIEQPAGGVNLDSIADRLLHRLAYRTLAGGVQSFVLNFSVNVSGVNPTTAATYQSGIRWAELRRTGTLAGTVTVNDQGTYAPGAGNGATGRNIWMASVAQDYLGNIGLGFSASSTTLNTSILYAGRLTTDPAGQLAQGENTIVTGGGVQTSTSNRWGDYSSLTVDPVDETTFWYTQEYYAVTAGADWRTRIGSFKVDAAAPAQAKGTINGTVTNCATGQPLANVVIMTADGFFRQSAANGTFSFPVAPGTYTVMVTPPPGYSGGCTQTVTVAGGGTATVNCCLTPIPVIAAMGATITAESCQPANGAIDPGETVTVSFGVKNTGTADTVNLVGTLQATGGVTSPSGPQNYGVVVAGGATVTRTFTFTANGTCGGTITASLQLQDGNSNLGTVTYSFNLGALGAPTTTNYSSGNIAVSIIDSGTVDVPITISDTGVVQDINVRVRLNHTFDSDLVISLVAPDNTIVPLAANRGGSGDNFGTGANDCSGTPTIFDDSAATAISAGTAPFAGTFRPESVLSAMNGKPSNGTWKLRVQDTADLDVGTIGCFTIEMTRAAYVCCTTVPVCTLTCPTNITVPATTGSCAAVVTYPAPTTTAGCGTVTCTPASGTSFSVGTTTVSCSSSTGGGACSFTVTVQDTQAPTITCPANVTANGSGPTVVNYPAPTANDNCPGVTAACVPASGSSFPLGTTTVTCTASDASQISPDATCTFTVTVTPCTITCPANQVAWTSGTTATVSYPAPTTTGSCGTVTCTPPSGSSFNVGTTTVTCSTTAGPSCSFTVTVNRLTLGASLADPLACSGPGNQVNGSFSATNTTGASASVTVSATLSNLVYLPNTATASVPGTVIVLANVISWTGTLGAGQTVTVSYLAQIADNATPGTQACSVTTATVNAIPVQGSASACITVNCPPVGPGGIFPASSEAGDQKAGSVLVYNIYTSGATSGNTQNTRINITNTHLTLPSYVHLFFVAESCAVADSYICLTGNQTASFLASDLDPGTTGYLVAIAVNAIGCPTSFNYLIGDEYVKFTTGHAANLGAIAFSQLAGGLPACDGTSSTAAINFDGISYNRTPATLALDNVGSRADGNDTLLILNRIGGNLGIGASSLGTLFGIFYDDAENALSFSVTGGCQLRNSITNNFPRITPRFETFVPAGRTGWLKIFNQTGAVGITGAAINSNPNAASSAGAFNQGHNLHHLTLNNTMNYIIPVFPPSC